MSDYSDDECNYTNCSRDMDDNGGERCDCCKDFYCDRHVSQLMNGYCSGCRSGDPFREYYNILREIWELKEEMQNAKENPDLEERYPGNMETLEQYINKKYTKLRDKFHGFLKTCLKFKGLDCINNHIHEHEDMIEEIQSYFSDWECEEFLLIKKMKELMIKYTNKVLISRDINFL